MFKIRIIPGNPASVKARLMGQRFCRIPGSARKIRSSQKTAVKAELSNIPQNRDQFFPDHKLHDKNPAETAQNNPSPIKYSGDTVIGSDASNSH